MWLKSICGDIVNAQRIYKHRTDLNFNAIRWEVFAYPGKVLLFEARGYDGDEACQKFIDDIYDNVKNTTYMVES